LPFLKPNKEVVVIFKLNWRNLIVTKERIFNLNIPTWGI